MMNEVFVIFTLKTKNVFNFIFFYFFVNYSESDLIPGLGTFFACLFLRLEIGILIGVGLNLISILYHAARPKLSIKINTVSRKSSNNRIIKPIITLFI